MLSLSLSLWLPRPLPSLTVVCPSLSSLPDCRVSVPPPPSPAVVSRRRAIDRLTLLYTRLEMPLNFARFQAPWPGDVALEAAMAVGVGAVPIDTGGDGDGRWHIRCEDERRWLVHLL